MNDTLIFLVLAGIAVIFKWFNRDRPDETQAPPPPSSTTPVPRSPAQSEEEKIRRFMEALGAPPGSRPPPPVRPRQITPRPQVKPQARSAKETPARPNRTWAQPLPPLVTTPPEEVLLPPIVAAPEPIPPEVLVIPPARPVVRQSPARALPTSPALPSSLGEMLRTPGSARRAIILREVLGPPRGVQPIGLAPH